MARISQTSFNGGISNDAKEGLLNCCRYSRNMNPFEDTGFLTQAPKATKVSGSTVVGLIKDGTDCYPWTTDKYWIDDGGNIYKETSGGTWTVDRTIAGQDATGQGLGMLLDYLYYANESTLGRKGPLSNSPAYDDDFVTTLGLNVDQFENESGQTYTTPTSIAETAANLCSFDNTIDPLKEIGLTITSKGTGDVTLTLHDENDIEIGTVTIANASLSNGAENKFTFATPLRVSPGKTYHIHVTSTVADCTIQTGTASDLSDAWIKTYFMPLVADTLYHNMIEHTNGVGGTVLIANGPYIAEWDGFSYSPCKIRIEPGFKIRSWSKEDEFVVANAWRGDAINDSEHGRLYYWDGISPYFNFTKEIKSGMANSITNFKARTMSILGSKGELFLGVEPFRQVQEPPKLARGKTVEVRPNALNVHQGRAVIGYGNTTDDTSFEAGVFEFGTSSDRALSTNAISTEVLNFPYTPSHGEVTGNDKDIGVVFPAGRYLYFSWKNDTTYGMDRVDTQGEAAAEAVWESIIHDETADVRGALYHSPLRDKVAQKLLITFEALPAGCTVTPKAKFDRAASFTNGSNVADEGDTQVEYKFGTLDNLRYKEVEFGFNVASSNGNYIVITGVYFFFDPLLNEKQHD